MADQTHADLSNAPVQQGSVREVFLAFLKLGLTSFGGPVAHIGFFRDEFVGKRKWLSDASYADIVALCQFMPGPASSQVGMALGLKRAGYGGMIAAWVAFTTPSALILLFFGLGVASADDVTGGWLLGLKAVAVAVVAGALWGMAQSLCPDKERRTLAIAATILMLVFPHAAMQIVVIAIGAGVGLALFKGETGASTEKLGIQVPRQVSVVCLIAFFTLLAGLPLVIWLGLDPQGLQLFDAFYRAGALVFGGGHVVLPLLEQSVVEPGWIDQSSFLAGYGAAQAVPGPLFTLAAYLGAAADVVPNGVTGAFIAIFGIFASSFLLVLGLLPFWEDLRGNVTARKALTGVNAAVVGLLGAALYDPVFSAGVTTSGQMAFVLAAFIALHTFKLPAWAVVIAGGLLGWVML